MSDDNRYGKFVIEPLREDWAHLGNSLRRVLLSSCPELPLHKVDGVLHELSVTRVKKIW